MELLMYVCNNGYLIVFRSRSIFFGRFTTIFIWMNSWYECQKPLVKITEIIVMFRNWLLQSLSLSICFVFYISKSKFVIAAPPHCIHATYEVLCDTFSCDILFTIFCTFCTFSIANWMKINRKWWKNSYSFLA